ncbi:MAG TPA: hypothetical protein VIS54_01410, partial [Psychromonas sp.]
MPFPLFEYWHIVGNSEDDLTLDSKEQIVFFNHSIKSNIQPDLVISNQYSCGKHKTFKSIGIEPVAGFTEILNNKALYL